MNYQSQLRSWAIDRAIELHKAGLNQDGKPVTEIADALLAYTYIGGEDLNQTIGDLLDLVAKAEPNSARIDEIILNLQQIQDERWARKLDVKQEISNESSH